MRILHSIARWNAAFALDARRALIPSRCPAWYSRGVAHDLELKEGTLLGGEFRIQKPLSAGGMGAVYIAEQTTTGKLRALKLMHRELVADVKLRERFEQEARVGSL